MKAAVFDCDVTPAPGSLLTYDPMRSVGELSLRCRGVVLMGNGAPVVLCAVDWIGIANEGFTEFRQALAEAAGTEPGRVALHALHQHDSPICDYTTEKILRDFNKDPGPFRAEITRPLIARAATAVRGALPGAAEVTEIGWGEAEVRQVASNRRVFDSQGKFLGVRYTACKTPELIAAPEGVIDPLVKVLSLWGGDKPLAVISYYATHPQSYYRTGIANPDFPGIARFLRGQSLPGPLHIHFDGAGGNIGAGKYNDGSPENRTVLAQRLADGMAKAFAATQKQPVTGDDLGWSAVTVRLPVNPALEEKKLELVLLAGEGRPEGVLGTAMQLAWLRGSRQISVGCLRLGSTRVLQLPGELFVEFQLAAAARRPDLHVAMAAYSDYGPGYIGTARAFGEGGYEVQPSSSFVGPEAEPVLLDAINQLLGAPAR
ncbi:MAG: hypothetical protein EOP86_14550 [Verrucomicrobiaceae bacterium]|nr:MAG: hypothetical protein EOP86_14550 [Verrucomicrobiaceae bacterium]